MCILKEKQVLYLLGLARLGGEAAGESARSTSVELVDCPSLTFSSRGAKRAPPLSTPCGQGSLTAVLAVGAMAAALMDSPVGDPPLCNEYSPSIYTAHH